jgi:hypothetical protein
MRASSSAWHVYDGGRAEPHSAATEVADIDWPEDDALIAFNA